MKTAARRHPRSPEHVSYVHQAGRVDALYIPDADADPRQVLDTILDRERWAGVEWIATLVRDGRWWCVESSDHDPFPDSVGARTKKEGMVGLRQVVAEHLAAGPGRCPVCQDGPGTSPRKLGADEEDVNDGLVAALSASERLGVPVTLPPYVEPDVRAAVIEHGWVEPAPPYALTGSGVERAGRVRAERVARSRAGSTVTRWAYDADQGRDVQVAQAGQLLAAAGHQPVRLVKVGDGPWQEEGDGYRLRRTGARVRVTCFREGLAVDDQALLRAWKGTLRAGGFTAFTVPGGAVEARRT